jgi:hypothetical protein
MALTKSNHRLGIFPMPIGDGGELISVRSEITPAAAGAGDIFSMLEIPVDHILVDVILDSDDLDSNGAPTITLSVGYLLGDESDLDVTNAVNGDGAAFIVASTLAQAGGMARPTTKSLWRAKARAAGDAGAVANNGTAILRYLGIKVVAASATFQAGKVGLTAVYRPASYAL